MLNDLHHIGIVVDDLDAAENFYDNVLFVGRKFLRDPNFLFSAVKYHGYASF